MNHTQRYLLLSNMYPSPEQPVYGVFVRNMERELVSRGSEVDHVVIQGRPDGLLRKLYAYTKYTLGGMSKLLRKDYSLVYVHFISLSAIPLILCWPFFRGKVVFNAHGSDLIPDTRLKSAMLKLMSPIIRRADLMVVPSTYYAGIAKRLFPEVELFVSPSAGVDTSLFCPGPEKDFNSGRIHIGFVSRIDPGKGWDTLIDSIGQIPESIRKLVRVTVVGGGSEQSTMETRIIETGLGPVIHCTGSIAQQELITYYQDFDVFVFPTRRRAESLGLVGLEALCCGVPVIASNIAGPAEYIQDQVNGWLFPPGDAAALAELITQYSGLSAEEKRHYSLNAARAAQTFNKDTVADSLFRKLEQTVLTGCQ